MYSCKLEIIMSDESHHFLDFGKSTNKLTEIRKDELFGKFYNSKTKYYSYKKDDETILLPISQIVCMKLKESEVQEDE